MPPNTYISIKGTRLRETEKAVQFCIHDISGDVLDKPVTTWFPFSQISKSTTSHNEGEDTMMITEWIAQQKELI